MAKWTFRMNNCKRFTRSIRHDIKSAISNIVCCYFRCLAFMEHCVFFCNARMLRTWSWIGYCTQKLPCDISVEVNMRMITIYTLYPCLSCGSGQDKMLIHPVSMLIHPQCWIPHTQHHTPALCKPKLKLQCQENDCTWSHVEKGTSIIYWSPQRTVY